MLAFDAIDIQPTAEAMAARVADWLIQRLSQCRAPCRIALSGGSTPKRLFELLAQPARACQIPWGNLHLFWGDERFVPPESPDSNAGMARRLLLDHVPIPAAQVFAIPTDTDPEAAAARYAHTLQTDYGASVLEPGRPLFALNLLGLGEDGHTASLIPGQPVLAERSAWVAAVGAGRPEVRLTLTYPVLESAAEIAFLVSGANKRAIVAGLRDGTADVPAAHLKPQGRVLLFMDSAAAGS